MAYKFGRLLQIAALLAMPFSLWVGWLGHDEAGSITIFLLSLAVFWGGFGLTRIGPR